MKTVVVTGATSGIGLAVCRELASLGYGIIGVGRSTDRCNEVAGALQKEFPGIPVAYFRADLSRQSEALRAGREICTYIEEKRGGALRALVSNAGGVRSYYTTTEDGYETVFALNHLAGFLLSHALLPCLKAGGGRLLVTSSASHKGTRVNWRDIMFRRRYNPLAVYKQSKLLNALFAFGFRDRFSGLGVSAACVDPGLVRTEIGLKDTGGLVKFVWGLRMKRGVEPEVPARAFARLIDAEEPPRALYYRGAKPARHSRQVNRKNADRLWNLSEQLSGAHREEAKT